MKISDYISQGEGFFIAPEVQYACELLERHGEILFINFSIDNAVQKASEMVTVFLDEEDWTEIRRKTQHGEWT